MTNKKTYSLDGIDDAGLIEEQIEETGLYWRHRLGCWQIWYVDDEGRKTCVGECDEQLGVDAAHSMWDEFVFIAVNEISSVYDIVSEEKIS